MPTGCKSEYLGAVSMRKEAKQEGRQAGRQGRGTTGLDRAHLDRTHCSATKTRVPVPVPADARTADLPRGNLKGGPKDLGTDEFGHDDG